MNDGSASKPQHVNATDATSEWTTRVPDSEQHRTCDPDSQRGVIRAFGAGLDAGSAMRNLLSSTGVNTRLCAYEAADLKAERARNWYKFWAGVALALVTSVTLIAALTLLPVKLPILDTALEAALTRYVSAAQSAANLLALVIIWAMHRFNIIDRWLTERADAERLRMVLFRETMQAPLPHQTDAGTWWAAKLAFFNTALVGYQRGYFSSAHDKHSTPTTWTITLRGIAIAATLAAVGVGVLSSMQFWPQWLNTNAPWLELTTKPVHWQLALNTLASSLLAYVGAKSLINQDERNTALYAHTCSLLDTLVTKQRVEVKSAAIRGESERVMQFVDDVCDILEADHRLWQLQRPPPVPIASDFDG